MGDEKGAVGLGDLGEEGMQCREHPYRSNPGGICAFCLQEKLGKLVSSTNSTTPFFPVHPPPSSNNSSPPSFRSINSTSASTSTALPSVTITRNGTGTGTGTNNRAAKISKIPSFLSRPTSNSTHNHNHYQHNNKKEYLPKSSSSSSTINTNLNTSSLKPVVPKPSGEKKLTNPLSLTADSPRKKSFWSFLYLSSSSSSSSPSIGGPGTSFPSNASALRRRSVSSYSSSRTQGANSDFPQVGSTTDNTSEDRSTKPSIVVVEEEETLSPGGISQNQSQASSSSFGRKVARSRSVGCGSRSFSGDFLERLSNGFGDCTLRRVESHRESHNKPSKLALHLDDETELEQRMRRIKCSGFFGSSASSYWLSAGPDQNGNGARMSTGGGGRSNRTGWGWAFASPMRAFKPATNHSSSSSVKSMPQSNSLPPVT